MNRIYPQFYQNIQNLNLIKENDTVISACSGGKDSVAQLLLLIRLQQDLEFDLKAAYFNHKIRPDSTDEQNWVSAFCRQNQVELIIGNRDVIKFKNQNKLNLEHAASISRYSFLNTVCSKYPAGKIATGHSKSDLTETFIIKLLRGSGLQGLSGIYGLKGEKIIRPLLIFTKEEIKDFLIRNQISCYSDPSNESESFLRNRIRKTLVPVIKEIEPAIDNHIYKTVEILQQEYDYFRDVSREILSNILIAGQILPFQMISDRHLALKRHLVREYLRSLKGNLLNIDSRHINCILNTWNNSKGVAVPGVELGFHRGYIFPKKIKIKDYRVEIQECGSFRLRETGMNFEITETSRFKKPSHNNEVIIPKSLVRFPLVIRSPRPEDKYIKINSTINQRVIEMIRISGIPAQLRNICPVVQDSDKKLIWVVGSPVADYFKVGKCHEKDFIRISAAN